MLSDNISVNKIEYVCGYEPKLKLFIDERELLHHTQFYEKRTKVFTEIPEKCFDYFTIGKFFLFIAITPIVGIKILHSKKHENSLDRIIQIQRLLFDEGFSFNCEDIITEFNIKDNETDKTFSYLGYISETDINKNSFDEFDIGKVAKSIIKIFRENKIDRNNLGLEMLKRRNYILASDRQPKLIDIDPYFYYVK